MNDEQALADYCIATQHLVADNGKQCQCEYFTRLAIEGQEYEIFSYQKPQRNGLRLVTLNRIGRCPHHVREGQFCKECIRDRML
jgi:hypothetical protein